jgi:hypothetical protein
VRFYRRIAIVEAEQLTTTHVPRGVALVAEGWVIRVGDYCHEHLDIGDYVVYPDSPYDEDGEPTYPDVWKRQLFERIFEVEK